MRFTPFLTQAFFVSLAAFAFWESIIASSHPTRGTDLKALQDRICSPLHPGDFSPPQPHAPGGIQLAWLGEKKGGLACNLIKTFQVALHPFHGYTTPSTPPLRTFTLSFLAYIPAVVSIFTLSFLQFNGRSWITVLIGLFYQIFTAGVVVPLLASAAVFLPPPLLGGPGRKLGSLEVEGVFFGVVVGCALPSWITAFVSDQRLIMAWQFFPLVVWMLERGYVLVGRSLGRTERGNPKIALRLLGGFLAVTSHAAHLPILVLALTSPQTSFFQTLSTLYLPSLTPTPLSLVDGIHRLLQYDFLVTHIALITLFTYRLPTRRGLVGKLVFATVLAGVTLLGGPRMAVKGGWWWVEERGWSEA